MPEAKKPKFRFEDNPALAETFADSIGEWFFDGSTLRIEFTVSRIDPRKDGEAPTGRKHPTCRLVLSSNGAIELMNRCRQFSVALEKAGLVKSAKTSDEPLQNAN
jgi:hypothetical protein